MVPIRTDIIYGLNLRTYKYEYLGNSIWQRILVELRHRQRASLQRSKFAPIHIAIMTTHIPFFTLPEQFFSNAALSTLFPLALGFGLGLWTSR
jgi:hypothetical protein